MSLIYKSLNGLETITVDQLANAQRITLLTAAGMQNVTWGTLFNAISDPLMARMDILEDALEDATGGGGGATVWPIARTITLTGAVTGAVAMDGSQNVSMATSIADGSLTLAKVNGLSNRLDTLDGQVGKFWGTGYTAGPQPSNFVLDANLITGATFLQAVAGSAANIPTGGSGNFSLLTNGATNAGNQIALRNGEAWLRGQAAGTWSSWNKLWTSANLDPSNLLLKTDTATAATKLATPRSFALTGLVTASGVTFDGTGNLSLTTAMADGALSIAKTSGLQAALDTRLQYRGTLAVSTPLNGVTASGIYTQTTASEATAANNYPLSGAIGHLRVTNQGGLILQEYITQANMLYRRMHDGSSWTGWTKALVSSDFDPATKYDKTGGAISGFVTASDFISSSKHVSGTYFQSTATTFNLPVWMMINGMVAGRQRGVRMGVDFVSLANVDSANNIDNHELVLTDTGLLTLNGHTVYHSGNFDTSTPVPTSGVLNIGNTEATHMRLRNDGKYSLNGGTTWREINEAPQAITDPQYVSVSIGADADIFLYEDSAGTLGIRTGSAADYRFYTFGADGNLRVPNGRVYISGNEAWHAGNFDPATKLGVSATAAAATKLATARTINGVAFDGTQNISITAPTVLPDNPIFIGTTYFDVDNGSTGKFRVMAADSSALNGVFVDSTNHDASALAPMHIRGSAVLINGGTAWHGNNFNPGTKADLFQPTFTGLPVFAGGGLKVHGWGGVATNGVLYFSEGDSYIYKNGGNYSFKNVEGGYTAILNAGGNIWTTGNFDPATKLGARGNLGTMAETIGDWNNAVNNGWYMAPGALNAPGGLGDWMIGTVTQHNGDWIQQEVYRFTEGGTNNGAKWYRWKKGGTWSAWTQDVFVGGALLASRVASGYDSGLAGSISCSNWFRAQGQTGFYLADYGGGIYMTDTTYVRTYNGKQMAAADFVISSDMRLKDEVGPLTLRKRLRPISFRWKESGVLDFGFSAQEVEEDYPEAVGEIKKDDDGLLGQEMIKQLSYHKLTAVLAAQTNDNSDEIDALKQLTREQAASLQELQDQMAALKQLVADLRSQ